MNGFEELIQLTAILLSDNYYQLEQRIVIYACEILVHEEKSASVRKPEQRTNTR